MNIDRARTPELPLQVQETTSAQKKFTAGIDRVLATFDAIESWPDNIAFLNKLLRVVQTQPTLPLPRAFEISNCLALCVLPKLPSGVQQRALEVYSYIFSARSSLAQNLPLFMTGLSPILGYSSTTVKNQYLELLSTFVVPLGTALRPSSTMLVLALLPGLEDEHDESFSSCINLMDEIKLTLGEPYLFWSSLWFACLSVDSGPRSGALNYMLRRMSVPHITQGRSNLAIYMGAEPGLFVRAFAAGLTDENTLVQRGFLELLLSNVRLSQPEVMELVDKDKKVLLLAGCEIVLRRDVGLNRRLWLWLTDSKESVNEGTYFRQHGARLLSEALIEAEQSSPIKVNKILLSLLDRDDIGGEIVADVFPEIITHAFNRRNESDFEEILTSSRAVFQALSSQIVLRYLHNLCEIEAFEEALFFVSNYDLSELEETRSRMPTLFLRSLARYSHDKGRLQYLLKLSELFGKHDLDIISDYNSFRNYLAITCDSGPSPDAHEDVTFATAWLQTSLLELQGSLGNKELLYELLLKRLKILPPTDGEIECLLQVAHDLLSPANIQFDHVNGISLILLFLYTDQVQKQSVAYEKTCQTAARRCWQYMGSQKLKYEVTSTRLMSSLMSSMQPVQAESFLAILVAEELASDAPIDKFGALWTHYNTKDHRLLLRTSLLLVLDNLTFGNSLRRSYILRWIHTTSSTADQLFEILLEPIESHVSTTTKSSIVLTISCTYRQRSAHFDSRRVTYSLRLLQALLSRTQKSYNDALRAMPVLMTRHAQLSEDENSGNCSLHETLMRVVLAAFEVDLGDDDIARTYYELCLEIAYRSLDLDEKTLYRLEVIILHKLTLAIGRSQYELQQLFLQYLRLEDRRFKNRIIPADMVVTLIHGIRETRQHPVLQDFLAYLRAKTDNEEQLKIETTVTLIECIVEQLDLNLIDIDAVLTTHEQSETSTAHVNEILFLDSLELLLGMLPTRSTLISKMPSTPIPQTTSFMSTTFLSAASNKADDEVTTTSLSEPSAALDSITAAALNVWLWAARNDGSSSSATRYISDLFADRAFKLIKQIRNSQTIQEILQIFVHYWFEASPTNQSKLESLYSTLFGEEQVLLLCNLIKASLSFSMAQTKRIKEDRAARIMLYTIGVLKTAKLDAFAAAISDSIAMLRHLTLHLPFASTGNALVLTLVSMLCSKSIRTSPGQQKKTKREFMDNLTKIYHAVTSIDVTEHLDSTFASALLREIPKLPETFLDLEKTSGVVSILMTNIIQPRARLHDWNSIVSQILLAITNLSGFRKLWKREVQDFFHEPAFFKNAIGQAKIWSQIMANWADGEREKLNELTIKASTSTPGHLFISTEVERQQRSLQIHQLSFLLLAMPADAHIQRLPAIFARAQEASTSKPVAQADALVLLQALILQNSPIHLKNYWTIIRIELHRGFLTLMDNTDTKDLDTNLLYAVLRTLDILLYLEVDDFLVHNGLFINDTIYVIEAADDKDTFPNLMEQLLQKIGADYQGASFQSLLRVPDALEPNIRDYVQNVGLLYHDWRQRCPRQNLDLERVRDCILNELFRF